MDAIRKARSYPTLETSIPLFMGTGGRDVDSPAASQVELSAALCHAGSRVAWHLYPDLDHSATVNGSLPDSTPFVERAFSGEPMKGNCHVKK
jgi:acetyl esterase/lipase